MGNPHIKLNQTSVIVNGFFFNIGMTIFREQFEKQRPKFPSDSVITKLSQHIKKRGYEDIMDTILHFDAFVSTENDRSDLIQWLQVLMRTVLEPDFQLPEVWQKLLRGEIAKTPPIPITREHFIGIAYVYQMMIDLIEGKFQERLVRRLSPPPDWKPDVPSA
jgi:hypothetical protein